jgi:hypothetical protein
VPRIVLQQVEVFPALRETMVSVFCLFAQEGIFLSSSFDLQAQRNQMFCDKVVLIFIIRGLKEDEITECTLEGYTAASHFCRKNIKGEEWLFIVLGTYYNINL